MFVIMDIWHSINSIFTSADMVTLAIMAVIALGAGFAMQGMGSLITATFGALVVFGLAGFVRAVTTGKKDAMALAQTDWHSLLGLQMQVLIGYAVAFAIVIALVHLVRSAVMR
jgi:hypothetical protein